MRGAKVPNILRHPTDHSITLWHGKPQYSLLWLHGLADQNESYLPIFTHLQSPLYHNCRIKLLQAPSRFITVSQEEQPAWFNLKSTQRFAAPEEQVYDLDQLRQTVDVIAGHCREEEEFWKEKEPISVINPQHRVFLGGFSQGAVAALHYGISA
jgi:predicted esterase